MTEIIDDIVLDDFQRLTSYDIKSFFSKYLEFIDIHYSNIANFFSGSTNVVPTEANKQLDLLISEHKKIVDVIILNSVSLNNYAFWALTEYVESIGHTLKTAGNASKWLRSSVTKTGYKQKVLVDYMLSQGENIEQAERKFLKSNNSKESWIETALENEAREEDYTLNGGYLIKVNYKNNVSIFLNSIVDNIDTPDKTYGKDIQKEIAWEDNDLVVLNYKDTIVQSAGILANLQKEDDPAFPDRGTNTKGVLGQSSVAVSYPVIFRDLASNFATDDSFKSFQITDVRKENDAIFIDFSVETRVGDFFNDSIAL